MFVRTPRAMTLTPAGDRLLQAAKKVLEELDVAEREIANAAKGVERTLILTTQCATVYYWLPAQLKKYQRDHPTVNVRVVVDPRQDCFEALLLGKIDLVISCNPVRNRRIQYTPLFQDENVLTVANDHRLAGRKFVTPKELEGEDFFVYPPRDHSSFLANVMSPAGVSPRSIQEVMLTEAMIEMIKGGLGVASLAKWIVAPHVLEGSVSTVRIGPSGFWRSWSLATRRSTEPSPHIDAFVNLLAGKPFRISGGRQRPLLNVNFSRPHAVAETDSSV